MGREGKEEDNRREYDVSNGTRLFEIQQSGKARLNPRVCQRGAVIEINNSLGGKLKTEIRSSFDRAPPRDEKVINVAQIEPGHFRIYLRLTFNPRASINFLFFFLFLLPTDGQTPFSKSKRG